MTYQPASNDPFVNWVRTPGEEVVMLGEERIMHAPLRTRANIMRPGARRCR